MTLVHLMRVSPRPPHPARLVCGASPRSRGLLGDGWLIDGQEHHGEVVTCPRCLRVLDREKRTTTAAAAAGRSKL